MEGQPLFLLLHNPRQLLVVVSHDMMLTQYSVDIKGETTLIMNVCGAYSNVLSISPYNYLWLLIYEFVSIIISLYECLNSRIGRFKIRQSFLSLIHSGQVEWEAETDLPGLGL